MKQHEFGTLRRDHSPFRGQLAKARRAIHRCANLKKELPERDWCRRMLWHRAWEHYGNSLGKEPNDPLPSR